MCADCDDASLSVRFTIILYTCVLQFLLSDEEVIIVRELFGELFSRQQFDAERFYFTPPSES